jgi:hypothetical protein
MDRVSEEMPFPVHRLHIDRGRGLFVYKVQEQLIAYGRKFGSIQKLKEGP